MTPVVTPIDLTQYYSVGRVRNTAKQGNLVEIARGRDEVERFLGLSQHNAVQGIIVTEILPHSDYEMTVPQGTVRHMVYVPFGHGQVTNENCENAYPLIVRPEGMSQGTELNVYPSQTLNLAKGKHVFMNNTPSSYILLQTRIPPFAKDEISLQDKIILNTNHQRTPFDNAQQITIHRLYSKEFGGEHYHPDPSIKREETIFALFGKPLLISTCAPGEKESTHRILSPGESCALPPYAWHRIEPLNGWSVFLETTNQAFDPNEPMRNVEKATLEEFISRHSQQ